MRPTIAVRWGLTAAVAVPFLVSLALPSVTGDLDAPNTTASGLEALMMGFVIPFVWIANVFLPIGLVKFHSGRLK